MDYSISVYILLFYIYSFAGWIMEIINVSIQEKKLVSRGFLIGPVLPIYGLGAIFITLLLTRYSNDVIVLFVMTFILCCILEYFTSYIMEKLFNARWWDYSNKKFNINGRVCLSNCIYFGLGGLLIILGTNPIIFDFLSRIPDLTLTILAIIFSSIFAIDITISTIIIIGFRNTTTSVLADNTEEITAKVREILKSRTFLHRRLLNAFPNLEAGIQKLNKTVKQMEREIRKLNIQKKKLTKETEKLIKKKKELLKEKIQNIRDNNDNKDSN